MKRFLLLVLLTGCHACTTHAPPTSPDAAVPSCGDVACVPGRIACGYLTDAGVFEHPELCNCELADGSVAACHN